MVHVPVDDQHSLHVVGEKRARRDGDVVEVTETPERTSDDVRCTPHYVDCSNVFV